MKIVKAKRKDKFGKQLYNGDIVNVEYHPGEWRHKIVHRHNGVDQIGVPGNSSVPASCFKNKQIIKIGNLSDPNTSAELIKAIFAGCVQFITYSPGYNFPESMSIQELTAELNSNEMLN